MPLFKIPLLLWTSVCVHVSLTSPNPPPTQKERAKFNPRANDIVALARGNSPFIKKLVAHVLNGLEIAAILGAELYPGLVGERFAPSSIRITRGFAVSVAVMTVALAIRLACYHELGRLFTFELSLKKDHKLVTTGPYSIVRHPSYTACILQFSAGLVAQLGPGSWWYESGYWQTRLGQIVALSWVWFIGATVMFFFRRSEQEDGMLRKEFTATWVEWARRTPYKFFPYIL